MDIIWIIHCHYCADYFNRKPLEEMINTDFILVRDGQGIKGINDHWCIPVSEQSKKLFTYPHARYRIGDTKKRLEKEGYTVTVLDRSTMTRDEQREVFMLTRDASFYSYENLRWLIARADRADQLEEGMKWISVDERLPDANMPVLVRQKTNAPHFENLILAFDGKLWRDFDEWSDELKYQEGEFRSVTHWQPLPAPPVSNLLTPPDEKIGKE